MHIQQRPKNGLRVLLVTGPTGSGKSKLLELLEMLVDPPDPQHGKRVLWHDTSALITESKRRRTPTGKQLLELEQEQTAGKVLTPSLVNPCIDENISWLRKENPNLEFLWLAGSPRTADEAKHWLGMNLPMRFILATANDAEISYAIRKRMAEQGRTDDDPNIIPTKLAEYKTKILSAVNILPKEMVLTIERSSPLLQRMNAVVDHIAPLLPSGVHKRWKHRLDEETEHPIHRAIRVLEPWRNAVIVTAPQSSSTITPAILNQQAFA